MRALLWRMFWITLSVYPFEQSALAASCSTATQDCTEWITSGGGPARTLIYRTYSLRTRNDAITHAVVVAHGGAQGADSNFRHILPAAFLAGALDNVILIVPRFASNDGTACREALAPDELNWKCRGPEVWRAGGAAVDNEKVTSFHVVDEILQRLARKDTFPNLRAIAVAGHSAGGQFVTRYAMANRIHDTVGVAITYISANSAAYAYLDALRPSATVLPPNVAAAAPGFIPPLPAKPPQPFVPFEDAGNCTAYNKWPYGLESRVGYSARLADEELRKQFTTRPITYVLGALDILPLFGFDTSCSAYAQGATRFARGLAFARHVNENHGARHKTLIIPDCGHSTRCMFTAESMLPVIFPNP